MQKFQNMEHSNSMTFQGLSRAWNFFFKIQGPYERCSISQMAISTAHQ